MNRRKGLLLFLAVVIALLIVNSYFFSNLSISQRGDEGEEALPIGDLNIKETEFIQDQDVERLREKQGDLAFVVNQRGDDVAIVDLGTDKIIKRIPVGDEPHEAILHDGSIYVTNYNDDTISVIAIDDFNDVDDFDVSTFYAGESPHGLAIAGRKIYVTSGPDDIVNVFDFETKENLKKIPVRFTPHMIVAGNDGRIYVSHLNSDDVAVVNTDIDAVFRFIDVEGRPEGIALTPDNKILIAANKEKNSVSIVPTNIMKTTESVRVGFTPIRIAVKKDGKRAYVANRDSGDVSVINVNTGKVLNEIDVGMTPIGIALTSDDRYLLVANFNSGTLSKIDTETYGAKEIDVGDGPDSIVVVERSL